MSKSSEFLTELYDGEGLTRRDIVARVLTPLEANSLQQALKSDAADHFYSACVTFANAAQSLHASNGSWATIKLYYSVFFSMRSWLAASGTSLFYFDGVAFTIDSQPVCSAHKKTGNSHEIVFKEFAKKEPSDPIVTDEIDLEPALDWIKTRREAVNYRTERLCDPGGYEHFSILNKHGLRQLAELYLNDDRMDWRFDPDHAMLALPLDLLRRLRDHLDVSGVTINTTSAEKAHLKRCIADNHGTIPVLARVLDAT